jgi:LysR family hydrogen peroxide-inducible transcriptional activator
LIVFSDDYRPMTALPSLRQLGYLVALADTLNFTRAAQRCFVTQSTLSGALQELERTLGGQLVERSRQQVRLTPAGERAAARARGLLAAARDLADEVAGLACPMEGLLRLGAIPTIAPYLLPGLLGAMRDAHPRLKLALREDQTVPLLARLREGAIDFALIALPWDTDGLRVETVLIEELWLVAPRGDPALARASLRVASIDPQRLLLLEEGHCLREHTLAGCGLRESANPGGIEATSLATLVPMIEAGLGIGLLPEMALKAGLLERTRLIARPLAAPAPRRTIALVARQTSARQSEFEAIAAQARALAGGRGGGRSGARGGLARRGGAVRAAAGPAAQPPRSAS